MSDPSLTERRRKLAYLTNIPSHYRREMVIAWAEMNPQLEVSVFYTDSDDQGRGWLVSDIGHIKERRLPILLSTKRYGKLNRYLYKMVVQHDIIMIGGFEQASYLVAASLAKLMGKTVILLFDGFSPARMGHEVAAILALKRLTAKLANGFFANGTVGARYLKEQIGISPSKPVYNQYLSHFDAPIEAARSRWSGLRQQDVRRRLGLDCTGPLVISCGYLIERKHIACTIDAIASLPEDDRPALLIVGTGPLAEELELRARQKDVRTYFVGFKQAEALADYYFAADVMVLSSLDDPWGLVVNEAMSAGLPVIVSHACGAAGDLVKHGINGFVFPSQDAHALADALKTLLASNIRLMGQQSRSIIQKWTPIYSARSLGELVRACSLRA